MQKLIRLLSDMRAVSGNEYRINSEIKKLFEPYCDEVKIDNLGSVIALKKCGRENAPKLMIEAHIDEIGLMVTSVTDNGYITFADVGGVDERILPSLEVTVHGKRDIKGIITVPDGGDETKSFKNEELAIDTSLAKDEILKIISVGDTITLPQSVGKLGDNQLSLKTMDDRASVAVLIDVMKRISSLDLSCDVYAVAAVQEEVGCRGGKTTAFSVSPDMAIAIDVTHGITPDNEKNAFKLGSGAVISKGPNLHPSLTAEIERTAQEHNIKYSIDIDGGCTGTDAWEIQVAGDGVPVSLLSIPLKYMHTSVETLSVDDVQAVSDVLYEFIKSRKGDMSWIAL